MGSKERLLNNINQPVFLQYSSISVLIRLKYKISFCFVNSKFWCLCKTLQSWYLICDFHTDFQVLLVYCIILLPDNVPEAISLLRSRENGLLFHMVVGIPARKKLVYKRTNNYQKCFCIEKFLSKTNSRGLKRKTISPAWKKLCLSHIAKKGNACAQ